MKLLTKEIEASLPTIEATVETASEDLEVKVKYFTPDGGGTWYIAAYCPINRLMFGLCDLGMGSPELGYVSLDELEALRGALGLPVERDLYWNPCPLSEVMDTVMA